MYGGGGGPTGTGRSPSFTNLKSKRDSVGGVGGQASAGTKQVWPLSAFFRFFKFEFVYISVLQKLKCLYYAKLLQNVLIEYTFDNIDLSSAREICS